MAVAFGFLVTQIFTTPVQAQVPPGCLGSGIGINLFVDKGTAHVGDTLVYSVIVLNGPFPNCMASSITADIITPDGVTSPITLRRTTLLPGESDTYQGVATYVIRAQDVTPGNRVLARANVRADIHQNVDLTDGAATQSVETLVVNPCISISSDCQGGTGATGVITYSGTVRNCGDTLLTGVVVNRTIGETTVPILGPINLAVGESRSFEGSYQILNPCTSSTVRFVAVGRDTINPPKVVTANSESTCGVVLTPGIRMTAVCPPNPTAGGATLTYAGSITNTGNVALRDVVVYSDRPAPNTPVLTVPVMTPGQVVAYTGSFTAPTGVCSVTTSLRVAGSSLCEQPVADNATITCPIVNNPAIRVTQECPPSPVTPGQTLNYTGTVSNIGNVALVNVVVTSARPNPGTVVFRADRLEPGATASFSGSYSTPVDTCSISNNLSAEGRDACSDRVVTDSASALCNLVTNPSITVEKRCPPTTPDLGGTLNFTGTVRNTGNVTLQNVVVTVNRPSDGTVVVTYESLAPGESREFSGSYPIPSNLEGCAITDTVRAAGRDQCTDQVVTAETTTTCPVGSNPSIEVTKSCPSTPAVPGGAFNYTGTVRNTGDITLTSVVVTASKPTPGTVVFQADSLAPGESRTFNANYTAEANACSTTSSLTATANDACGGSQTRDTVETTCPLSGSPSIAVTVDCSGGAVVPGGTLTYSGTVRNTGNISLSNVQVAPSAPNAGPPVFGPVTLQPGETASYTGSYVVPQNISACDITTTVVATGNNICNDAQVSNTASTTCAVDLLASVEIAAFCPSTPTPQGGTLNFTGVVRNTGQVALRNVVVKNNRPTPGSDVVVIDLLEAGAERSFEGSFTVPVNCCDVVSTLTVTAAHLCTSEIVEDTSTIVCPVLFVPDIDVTVICPEEPVAPGGELMYVGEVTNSGNITLGEVMVYSEFFSENLPILGPISLAPGEAVPYAAVFTVPTDFCGVDTIMATGRPICGVDSISDSTPALCEIDTSPSVVVRNNVPSEPVARCTTVSSTASVENTGDVSLVNLRVLSNQPVEGTLVYGPITLPPGETREFEYEFTAPQDCDCCQLTVMLTAVGADKCSEELVQSTSTAIIPIESSPAIDLTIECPSSGDILADLGYFEGQVQNTGDITLTNVMVMANLPEANSILVGPISLAPGETEYFFGDVGGDAPSTLPTLEVEASGMSICRGETVMDATTCGGDTGGLQITDIEWAAGNVLLVWTSTPGMTYRVQYKTSLSSPQWMDLPGDVTAGSTSANKIDPMPGDRERFYQVVVVGAAGSE